MDRQPLFNTIKTLLPLCVHKLRERLLITLLGVAAFCHASSDDASLNFRTINISHGLSHNMVYSIYKDTRGFVWVGSQLGLDRFDGIQVFTYPDLKGHTVYVISESDSVYLWVGTDKGLIKMNRHIEQTEQIVLENKQSSVRSLYPLAPEAILVGTTQGLFIYENGKVEKAVFDINPLSSTNSVTSIIPGDEKGEFWITTLNGLVCYNRTTNKQVVYRKENTGFSCVLRLGHTLYLGTSTSGIVTFDIRTHSFSDFPYKGNSYIKALAQVAPDELYVGTNGGGVKRVSLKTGQIISSIEHGYAGNGISSNAVYSFLQDGSTFWIGTYMGGLNYTPTRGNEFRVYTFKDQFNSRLYNIRSFWLGRNGEKFIGTRDGFFYISEKENRVKHLTTKNSLLQSDIILSVFPWEGDCLVGTYGGGLYCFDPRTQTLSYFLDEDPFKHSSFAGYVTDDQGNLWIGSSSGVFVYTPKTRKYVRYTSTNSGLGDNSIFCITKDSQGRIWLGTAKAVYLYAPATGLFSSDMFPPETLARLKSVRYIYEDSHKNLWFCSDKDGVVKVDERFSSFEHYTTDNYLTSNSVTSLVEDERGALWFASQRGLACWHPETKQSQFYSLHDGIPGYIFNSWVQRTDDGTIWWGNEEGLVAHRPYQDKPEGEKSASYYPAITSISVAGKVLHAGDERMPNSSVYTSKLELPSGSSVEFTFSALNYSVEDSDIYEYTLAGYDKGWTMLTSGNKAFYDNLPRGKYLFQVRSSSSPDKVTSIQVNIRWNIPFMAWGIVGAVLVCVALLYSYSRLLTKYRQMMAHQAKREEESAKEKYARSKVEEGEVEVIRNRLHEYMRQEKPYLNPDLKLQDVAAAIRYSSVELSQVLNVYDHTNFTDFVNQYRVEEFILRVQDKSAVKYTLASLSEQSGFSSRTSFFRSFKRLKGKTPAEYVKDMGVDLCK